jgi:hypothetical protein
LLWMQKAHGEILTREWPPPAQVLQWKTPWTRLAAPRVLR